MVTSIEFKTVPFAELLSGQNPNKLSLKDCRLKLKTITRNTFTPEGREKIHHLNAALDATERLLAQLTVPSTPDDDADESTFVVVLDKATSPTERRFLLALYGLDAALQHVVRVNKEKPMDRKSLQAARKRTIGTARYLAQAIHHQRDGQLLAGFAATLKQRSMDASASA